MNPANYLIPMLDLYCEWLNRWSYDSDGGAMHVYELHQFMVTDPNRGLYGDARLCAVIPDVGWGSFMVVALVSDGEEGGPHEITAWFEVMPDNTTTIAAMVQGFDTSRQFIYQDHTFANLPEGDQR
jgi:hypothetical protein